MILFLTGHDRLCCIAMNYSTTIRCTMSPPGNISIAYRFSCDKLGLRLLHVWPLPTHRRASAISDFLLLPWQFTFVHPLLGHTWMKHSSRTVRYLQRVELIAYFSRLRTYPFHVEEKVLMLLGTEFRSLLRMAENTPSSVYKPLHEFRILRISNFPHLYELCTTLLVIMQHLPLGTVSSFTKCPALP
ncbi:hypothetical protein BHE74_00006953 [Ensete ventricosum]|nr:hypothetical protein BHE74_00006953 [Ensete ventricosum]